MINEKISRETEILLYLAQTGPQIQMRVVDALNIDQSNTSKRFSRLRKKKLIDEYDKEKIRNAYYPVYWLTRIGVNVALLNGADTDQIRTLSQHHLSKEDQNWILLACDIIDHPNLGIEVLKLFNIDPNEVARSGEIPKITLLLQNGRLNDFLKVLSTYKSLYNATEEKLENTLRFFKSLNL
jgi:hypothetical protein